jgi:hypothetical protein
MLSTRRRGATRTRGGHQPRSMNRLGPGVMALRCGRARPFVRPLASLEGAAGPRLGNLGGRLELHIARFPRPRSGACRRSDLRFQDASGDRSCPLLSMVHPSAADPAQTNTRGSGPVRARTPPALRSSATRDRSAGRARQGRCKRHPTDLLLPKQLTFCAMLTCIDAAHKRAEDRELGCEFEASSWLMQRR